MSVDGLLVVDKPAGHTSHDVVARLRGILHTRKVGHAGTLDPAATGVLLVGVGRGTKLLTYLVGADKDYAATIRLGAATVTDDAEGEIIATADTAAMTEALVAQAVFGFVGDIDQVPSAVSAIKVDGERAYARVRSGAAVTLAARRVTVRAFDVDAFRRDGSFVDVDVRASVSSGTYIRALARDLGATLGVGGHLTSLRRTRVADYAVTEARTLEQIAADPALIPLAQAARRCLPVREVDADETRRLGFGQALGVAGAEGGPVAAIGPDGTLIAIVADRGAESRPLVVFAPA